MTAIKIDELRPAAISHKAAWNDASWTPQPNIEVLDVSYVTPSDDLATLSLRYRYGQVKTPAAANVATLTPLNLDNKWVRVQYDYGPAGTPDIKNLFVGRFSEETREVNAFPTAGTATGTQVFTAYGPYQLMRKRSVHRSVWADGAAPNVKTINWLPPLNSYDQRNTIVGNRSTAIYGDSFVYSADAEVWNYKQYVEYLIQRFLKSTNAKDPPWSLKGDTNALADLEKLTQPIIWPETASVADMLHELINRQAGFDWYVRYGGTLDAPEFEIYVHTLTATDVTFGSSTIRANPNVTQLSVENNASLNILQVEKSKSQEYSRLRVIGNRLVVTGSFIRVESAGSVIKDGWEASLETEYETGAGIPPITAQQNDDYRSNDKFRDVYQFHHVVRDTTNLIDSFFPSVNDAGDYSFLTRAKNQDFIRETLSWTALRQGWEYFATFPTDPTPADTEPSYLPPQVWLQRAGASDTDPYVNAERSGVGVSPLPNDWGVQLYAFPNHAIADGKFTATNASEVTPAYKYDYMAFTVSWLADERFRMEKTLTADPPNADGVLDIYVPSAELWLICPDTIYGLDQNGAFRKSNANGMEARNDKDKLELAMAGAVARYQENRNRASVTLWGIFPPDGTLGYILEAINDGTTGTQEIKAPITSVRWNFDGQHTTTIKAGYAR